jgi:hypothetical protein
VRRRLVVLEGPDAAGKTTLARAIVGALGYEYRHEGPPPADDLDVFGYYLKKLTYAATETFMVPGVVLDRFALGERVYGPILRGQDRLGFIGWRRMRELLDELGAVRVLCLPSRARCLATWRATREERGELCPDPETFLRTYDAWDKLRWDRGQFLHDWTRAGDTAKILQAITGEAVAA